MAPKRSAMRARRSLPSCWLVWLQGEAGGPGGKQVSRHVQAAQAAKAAGCRRACQRVLQASASTGHADGQTCLLPAKHSSTLTPRTWVGCSGGRRPGGASAAHPSGRPAAAAAWPLAAMPRLAPIHGCACGIVPVLLPAQMLSPCACRRHWCPAWEPCAAAIGVRLSALACPACPLAERRACPGMPVLPAAVPQKR